MWRLSVTRVRWSSNTRTHGAFMAKAMDATEDAGLRRSAGARGALVATWMSIRLGESNSGVDPRVQEVDDQVERDDADGRKDDDPLSRRQVEPFDRLDCSPPQPRESENGFREDRPAERNADVHAEHGDDRQERVPQHVRAQDDPLGRALGASGADVVLAERLHRVRADHPDVQRGEQEGERRPRQDQVVGPLHGSTAVPGWVDEVAVARDREDAGLEAEEVGEQQPDPDRVRTDADEDEHHGYSVEQRSRPQRGEDAD